MLSTPLERAVACAGLFRCFGHQLPTLNARRICLLSDRCLAMPTVTRYSKISLQIIVAPDFATSSTSHYDWQGGFIGDTANRPVDHHDSNG
jgi:hypothetical protein